MAPPFSSSSAGFDQLSSCLIFFQDPCDRNLCVTGKAFHCSEVFCQHHILAESHGTVRVLHPPGGGGEAAAALGPGHQEQQQIHRTDPSAAGTNGHCISRRHTSHTPVSKARGAPVLV